MSSGCEGKWLPNGAGSRLRGGTRGWWIGELAAPRDTRVGSLPAWKIKALDTLQMQMRCRNAGGGKAVVFFLAINYSYCRLKYRLSVIQFSETVIRILCNEHQTRIFMCHLILLARGDMFSLLKHAVCNSWWKHKEKQEISGYLYQATSLTSRNSNITSALFATCTICISTQIQPSSTQHMLRFQPGLMCCRVNLWHPTAINKTTWT